MPYAVKWLIPDRVMLSIHYGVMDSADMHGYIAESMAIRDEANARSPLGAPLVHTITDARYLEKTEAQLKDVQGMLRSLRAQKVGWSVYVNPNPVNRFLVAIAHQFVGVRYYICPTVEDALNFLMTNDDTLPPMSAADVDALTHQVVQPKSV
jgi:ribosomal protein L30/L7E